jgi:tetratricopeptide (TPR) repeat protein
MQRRVAVLLLVLASCGSPPRNAEPLHPAPKASSSSNGTDEVAAQKHFENGKRLYGDKAWPEALTAFQEAYRLATIPEALRYIGLVQRQLHHPVAAYEAYEQLLAKFDAQLSPETKREAQKAIEELGAVTGTLLVSVNEAEADIEIDGRSAGRSPMTHPRRLRVGDRHTIRVTKNGFGSFEQQSVEVVANEPKKIEVKLVPEETGAGGAAMSDADKKATARAAFSEGVALQEKGDYLHALPRFQTAQRLHDAPTHLLHIAQCQASLQRLVEAQETYETLAHMPIEKGSPDAFQKAQDQGKTELPAVKARLPMLKVQIVPSGAAGTVVTVNGVRFASDLLGLLRPTNPGVYKLTATANGYKPVEVSITLAEKEQKTVELRLVK